MSISTLVSLPIVNDGVVSAPASPSPAGIPRRSFSPSQKLKYVNEYEEAAETRQGGAYLRRHGLYTSQIFEWRRQRDAGLLDGKRVGEPIGKLTAKDVEIAKLKAQLRRREMELETTKTALEIMGKAHALLEQISKSADNENKRGRH